MTEYYYFEYPSPLGIISIVSSDMKITHCDFFEGKNQQSLMGLKQSYPHQKTAVIKTCCQQLDAYFKGELRSFDLPLNPEGTDFQQMVWKALLTIPYGITKSYQQIATQINKPKACRAVGAANGRNPIAIIIPCHRVVGSDQSLTGYAGGIERKKQLLELEQKSGIM